MGEGEIGVGGCRVQSYWVIKGGVTGGLVQLGVCGRVCHGGAHWWGSRVLHSSLFLLAILAG